MFLSCTKCVLRNGMHLKFWSDRRIDGRSLQQLAPNLMEFVKPAAKSLTVAAAMQDNRWVAEIRGH
jgi:hypothetical protein